MPNRARRMTAFLAAHPRDFAVAHLPAHAPELDPEERCDACVKRAMATAPPGSVADLHRLARREFRRLQHRPELIAGRFRHAGPPVTRLPRSYATSVKIISGSLALGCGIMAACRMARWPMSRRQKDPLRALRDEERTVLSRLSRSGSAPAAQVARARALLAVAEGQSYTTAARLVGRRTGETVARWVAGFNNDGLAAGGGLQQ
jgi:hypothetical protein